MVVVEESMLVGSVGCQVSVLTRVGSWMFFSSEIFWSTWSFGRGDFRELGVRRGRIESEVRGIN